VQHRDCQAVGRLALNPFQKLIENDVSRSLVSHTGSLSASANAADIRRPGRRMIIRVRFKGCHCPMANHPAAHSASDLGLELDQY
jgi:hypothetical protein